MATIRLTTGYRTDRHFSAIARDSPLQKQKRESVFSELVPGHNHFASRQNIAIRGMCHKADPETRAAGERNTKAISIVAKLYRPVTPRSSLSYVGTSYM